MIAHSQSCVHVFVDVCVDVCIDGFVIDDDGCSDDGESETVSLRDYLSSNIFLYDWGNGDYDFYEPILLESGLAKIHQFKFNNNGNPCTGEDEYTLMMNAMLLSLALMTM